MALNIFAIITGLALSFIYGGRNKKKDKDIIDVEYTEKDENEGKNNTKE